MRRHTAEKGFVPTYLEWVGNQKSPERFHRFTALSILSAMLGRRCWLDRKAYRLFPNTYTILAGPSGRVAKNVCIGLGVRLLKQCGNCPEFFAGSTTGSALVGKLAVICKQEIEEGLGEYYDASIYMIGDELAQFIGEHPVNEQMIKNLTGLYGCPDEFEYNTRKHRKEWLKNVCINLLVGSTVDWMRTCLPRSAIVGGFFARFFVVHAYDPRHREYRIEVPKNAEKLEKQLVGDLRMVGMMGGEFRLTPKAEAVLERKSREVEYDVMDPLGPYLERKCDHAGKVAMALSAAAGETKVVTDGHVYQAFEWMEGLEAGMRYVLGEVSSTEGALLMFRVLKIIKGQKGTVPMKRSVLQQRVSTFAQKKELDQALDTLLSGGYVVSASTGIRGGVTYQAVREFVEERDFGGGGLG